MLDKRVITIPKEFTGKGELILMPRKEYEEYLFLKKSVPLGKMTLLERKAVKEGRKQIKAGKYATIKELHALLES